METEHQSGGLLGLIIIIFIIVWLAFLTSSKNKLEKKIAKLETQLEMITKLNK